MKRFKNILLICDGRSVHEALIGRAIWLAKSNGARLTLVDLVEAAPGELAGVFGMLPDIRGDEIEDEVLEFHRDRLARIAAPIVSEGIVTRTLVLQGIPFVEVIGQVLRDGHDLVMKGAGGESDGGSRLFASSDLHLLRKCPCPVWIMRKSGRRHYARVLAAVDPTPNNGQGEALNRLIMDLASSLSKLDGSELHVVNAWQLQEENTLRHSGFSRVAKAEVDVLVEARRKRSESHLNRSLDDYPDENAARRVHLLKGAARRVIPDLARKKRVELIVMGTLGRTGIRGLIIGNTAESILNQVDCSVLAVKPPGFETPVQFDIGTANVGRRLHSG